MIEPADSAQRLAACAPADALAAKLPELVEALRLLGHPLRFKLLCQLTQGPLAVSELAVRTGQSLSVISQQLALLRRAGLVHGKREVKQVFYTLARARMAEVAQALAQMAQEGLAQEDLAEEG